MRPLGSAAVVMGLDLLSAGAAFLGAYLIRFRVAFLPYRTEPDLDYYLRFALVVGVVSVVALHGTGVYRKRRVALEWDDVASILRGSAIAVLVAAAIGFLTRGGLSGIEQESYSRLVIGISWLLAVLLYLGWRLAWLGLVQAIGSHGWGLTRVLILGLTPLGVRFYQAVGQRRLTGYHAIGFLRENGQAPTDEDQALPVLGSIADLPELLQRERVGEVVAALEHPSPEEMARLLKLCGYAGVGFRSIPDIPGLLLSPVGVHEVAGFPLLALEDGLAQRRNRYAKRALDLVLALIFLVTVLPLGLALALVIRLTSRGSVFFRQERVGKDGRPFQMYKFRSMVEDAEERLEELRRAQGAETDPVLRYPDDPRVTRVGRFMRSLSLDELPQLLNVLKGEMSLVGPRPHVPYEVACYQEWQRRRLDVLPGITGLTQVSGRRTLSLDDMVKLDIYYMENWSVLLDLRILLQTLPIALSGKGAY
ncbi:MAG: sugar transferase [Candidatus Latescibacterota bacterium]|jgi:exopolysaccharide biosynthesis polyprenyl glycosylphosphotransferase